MFLFEEQLIFDINVLNYLKYLYACFFYFKKDILIKMKPKKNEGLDFQNWVFNNPLIKQLNIK